MSGIFVLYVSTCGIFILYFLCCTLPLVEYSCCVFCVVFLVLYQVSYWFLVVLYLPWFFQPFLLFCIILTFSFFNLLFLLVWNYFWSIWTFWISGIITCCIPRVVFFKEAKSVDHWEKENWRTMQIISEEQFKIDWFVGCTSLRQWYPQQ